VKHNGGVNEGYAERAIAVTRALLSLIFGHTAAEQRERTFVLENDRQRISSVSPVLEMHVGPEEFQFLPDGVLEDISKKIKFLKADQKQRFEIALTFVNRAINELDQVVRFSNLWMALEASTGGKPDRSLKRLQGSQNLSGVLLSLNNVRNELFHKGAKRQIPQKVERILFLAIFSEILSQTGVGEAKISALYSVISGQLGEDDLAALS
jgi:hypothetical protein